MEQNAMGFIPTETFSKLYTKTAMIMLQKILRIPDKKGIFSKL